MPSAADKLLKKIVNGKSCQYRTWLFSKIPLYGGVARSRRGGSAHLVRVLANGKPFSGSVRAALAEGWFY
jgi:hypothetical protein